MDSVTSIALHRADGPSGTGVPARGANADRALKVTATYQLTEAGRKASLLGGGDGHAFQQITLEISASRLHLVTVDARGVARLRLRPRYHVDAQQRIVRIDALPTYDAPPTIEDLLKDAARNHQLESAYRAERAVERTERRNRGRELRHTVAEAFLNDPAQRALVHPAPTPTRCFLSGETGQRLLFDADTDEGPAREVPKEAHRRFRADLRARNERNQEQRAAQLVVHEGKLRWLSQWIEMHGTEEQRRRQAAGVLPIDEALEAVADEVFAAAGDRPRYARDGAARLQAYLKQSSQHADVTVTPSDVNVESTNATRATAAQWSVVQQLQAALPDATITLRSHRLTFKHEPRAPALVVFGVLTTQRVGLFTLRREYAAPE